MDLVQGNYDSSPGGVWRRNGRSRASPLVPTELAVFYSSSLFQSTFPSQVSVSTVLQGLLGDLKSNLLSLTYHINEIYHSTQL